MLDDFKDIVGAFLTYWTNLLPSARVVVGFPDEREETEAERTYPSVAITIAGWDYANDCRYAGISQTRVDDVQAGTTTRGPLPVPIYLTFQVDVYSENREQEWPLIGAIGMAVGQRINEIVSAAGRKLWMIPETVDALDDMAAGDGLFRKSFRYRVLVWLTDATTFTEYLVKQLSIVHVPTNVAFSEIYEEE